MIFGSILRDYLVLSRFENVIQCRPDNLKHQFSWNELANDQYKPSAG